MAAFFVSQYYPISSIDLKLFWFTLNFHFCSVFYLFIEITKISFGMSSLSTYKYYMYLIYQCVPKDKINWVLQQDQICKTLHVFSQNTIFVSFYLQIHKVSPTTC